MATPTLANSPHSYQLLAESPRPGAATTGPKPQTEFLVLPTGDGVYPWCIGTLAASRIISHHKSLTFALRKCTRLNALSGEGAGNDAN